MAACSYDDPPLFWDSIVEWSTAMLHGKNLRSCLGRLCLGAVVYHIWKQRNDLQHGNTPRTEEALVANILWEVRSRVLAKGKFKNLNKNLVLVYRWNLHSLL
jgi:hypothetical protein